ncbi:MAG: archaeosortase/exosortase family protein [Verrucomicrobiota bacterium]|jgi:exosortase
MPTAASTLPLERVGETALRRRTMGFILFVLALSACFARPLYALGQYSLHDEFFSYIPLIPIISLYLFWLKRPELPRQAGMSWKWGAAAALGGIAVLIGWTWASHSGYCLRYWAARDVLMSEAFPGGWRWAAHPAWKSQLEDYLTFTAASYLLFVVAGCLTFFGTAMSRLLAFPIAFLAFMVPIPSAMLDWTMSFFQITSAVTASGFLTAAMMPVDRQGLILHLPGFSLLIAPECSGIHSTMVLLITSFLAGQLFLRSGWKRALLVTVVVPLAILRNGFRVFVIGELCVRISRDMINSPIHRKGGPIFFILSLIPFFALLLLLRKSELPGSKTVNATAKS